MFCANLIHATFLLQIVNEAAKFRYRSGNEFNCGGISFPSVSWMAYHLLRNQTNYY